MNYCSQDLLQKCMNNSKRKIVGGGGGGGEGGGGSRGGGMSKNFKHQSILQQDKPSFSLAT